MDSRFSLLDRKVFYAGSEVLREGDTGSCAYVIESGKVEIWRQVDGRRQRLGIIGDGGIFGEMALIDSQPRMASATALADTTCIVVSDDLFRDKMETADPFMRALLRIFVQNIRSMATYQSTIDPPDGDAAAAPR